MAALSSELELAFKSLNKARMDLEQQVNPRGGVRDPLYGYILDATSIDLQKVNKLNPQVAVRFAFPGERDSEVRLTYANPKFTHSEVKEIAVLHGLRTSYDPHLPFTISLARRLSSRELSEIHKQLEKKGFRVHDVKDRRSVLVGRGFFTDPRHLRVFDDDYDLVAAIPEEHNVLTVFDACCGSEVVATVLAALKK